MGLDIYLVCPCCECVIYTDNITHNLNKMAMELGVYKHLWRPDEISITTAKQLIEPLENARKLFENDWDKYKEFEPANGWGTRKGLLRFINGYLLACQKSHGARIEISR